MLRIVTFSARGLLLIGIFVYQRVIPLYAAKKGRQVDARVLSCQQKTVENEETGTVIKRYEKSDAVGSGHRHGKLEAGSSVLSKIDKGCGLWSAPLVCSYLLQ